MVACGRGAAVSAGASGSRSGSKPRRNSSRSELVRHDPSDIASGPSSHSQVPSINLNNVQQQQANTDVGRGSIMSLPVPTMEATCSSMTDQATLGKNMGATVSRTASTRNRSSMLVMQKLEKEHERGMMCPGFWRYQLPTAEFYLHQYTQFAVAGLICSNFAINMIEATVDPHKERYVGLFSAVEKFFNVAFFIELLVNMYATWFKTFWSSGWNIFDFVVVSIGMLLTFEVELPGPLRLLRLMRAFRVFRLFKRIESLKRIMDSLVHAIPGVTNAFLILLIVMSIYAILAVEFWSLYGAGGVMHNEANQKIELQTSRGQDFGAEYFGNFPKSLYTMFQVLTGDSWSEAIARPLLHTPDIGFNAMTAFFYITFVVINGIILINVVVAVLVQKMLDSDAGAEECNCGHKLEAESNFCRKCGEEQMDDEDDDVVCPQPTADSEEFVRPSLLINGTATAGIHAVEECHNSHSEDLSSSTPRTTEILEVVNDVGKNTEILEVVKDVASIKSQMDDVKAQLQLVAGLVQTRCIAATAQKVHTQGACPHALDRRPSNLSVVSLGIPTMGPCAPPLKDSVAPKRGVDLGARWDPEEAALQLPAADLPPLPLRRVVMPDTPSQVDVLSPSTPLDMPSAQAKFDSRDALPTPEVQDTDG